MCKLQLCKYTSYAYKLHAEETSIKKRPAIYTAKKFYETITVNRFV